MKKRENTSRFSFNKGFSQVRRRDVRDVTDEIMGILNLKNRQSFYQRRHGKIEPKVTEYEAIEAVFNKYDITDVWGE